MGGILAEFVTAVHNALATFALGLLEALLVLAVGGLLTVPIGIAAAWLYGTFTGRGPYDRILMKGAASMATLVASLAGALAALGAGPVVGVLVAVGVSIGVLTDIYYGFRLLGSRSIRIGDYIEVVGDNVRGRLSDIRPTTVTILQMEDGARHSVTYAHRKFAEKGIKVQDQYNQVRMLELNVSHGPHRPQFSTREMEGLAKAACSTPEAVVSVKLSQLGRDSSIFRIVLSSPYSQEDPSAAFMTALSERLSDADFTIRLKEPPRE